MRTSIIWTCLLAVSLSLLGCGQSPDAKKQRIAMLISRNQPDEAMSLAVELLESDPDDREAALYLAQTQMQLKRLDVARKTLDSLLESNPDWDKAREAKVAWVFVQMKSALDQTDFASSEQLQKDYDEAMKEGLALAKWHEAQGEQAEAEFLRARFADADAGRIAVMLHAYRNKLDDQTFKLPEGSALAEPEDVRQKEIERYEEQIKNRRLEAEHHYQKVLELDPRHFEATRLYATLLGRRQAWPELWHVAEVTAEQTGLPARLVERLAILVLMTPDEVQTRENALKLADKLLVNVEGDQKPTKEWRLTRARLYLVQSKPEQAQPMIEKVLAREPKDAVARYLMAQTYFEQGQYKAAKEILDMLSSQASNEADVQTLYGLTLMKLKEHSLAEEALRKAIDLAPNDPLPRRAMARLRATLGGGANKALARDIQHIYDSDRANPQNIRLAMQCAQARNDKKEVETIIEKTVEIAPLKYEHKAVVIDGYNYLKKYDLGERYAREMVQEKPMEMEGYLRLAEMLLKQDKNAEMKQVLGQIRLKFPETGSIDQLLGQLYIQRQAFDRAVEVLQKVITDDPNNLEARILLARAFASLANTSDALEQIDRVLDMEPEEPRAHALAARIYQFMGQPELADKHLSQVSEARLEEHQNPALLAQLKMRQEKFEDAKEICNRAIASGNADPMLRMLLANIYIRMDEPEQAEEHLIELTKQQPDNPQAFQLLARYYLRQRDIQEGLVELTELQKVNEPLARLAQATLLAGSRKFDEALNELRPIFTPLVNKRDKMALVVADAMAKILVAADRREDAVKVYEPLINVRHEENTAMLRQIDLTWEKDDEQTRTQKLDILAANIAPDEEQLRREVLRRFARMDKYDQSLRTLDNWIAQEPRNATLLRWKGEQLIEMGRAKDAVGVLSRAIELDPDNRRLHQRLALAHMASFDYPAAEKVFQKMAQMDVGSRIMALSELGHLFVNLGLNQQALRTFEQLDQVGRSHDPRIIYVMGKAFAALNKDAEAIERLKLVPTYAPQYAAAQVLLAQIEQRSGKVAAARDRLNALAADPTTASLAARELLKLNVRDRDHEELMRWSDQAIAMDRLDDETLGRWLRIRVGLLSDKLEWPQALETVEKLQNLEPRSVKTVVARILLLWRLTQLDEARQVFTGSEIVQKSPFAAPVAAMLGVELGRRSAGGLPRLFESLAAGKVDEARQAVDSIPPMRTIFHSDLLKILDRPDATAPQMAEVARVMIAAMLAREVGLPQMTEEICTEMVNRMPSFLPAHALLVQSLMDQNKARERDDALKKIRNLGDNALSLYLQALEHAERREHLKAVDVAKKLIEREPGNWYVEYFLAQQYQLGKEYDKAIDVLQEIARGRGPYKLIAVNDIAYTMAEHQPDKIDRAHAMALKAFEVDPNNMPLLDTIGWIEHLKGNDQQAIEHLSKAVLGLKELTEVHYHLGVAYKSLGNMPWAKYHLETAATGPKEKRETAQAKRLLANWDG